MRLHNAAYVGDLDTLRNLLLESEFKRWEEPDQNLVAGSDSGQEVEKF